ncbi:unnamed protein product [Cuscuta campestris]|uniref:Uncharacterized protein n=1 Tax=Cuscuta campestris TaxID=132261 RepID=A0A484MWG8_9ASTE|nr:unnamed protein product [Cuscuta campestris]
MAYIRRLKRKKRRLTYNPGSDEVKLCSCDGHLVKVAIAARCDGMNRICKSMNSSLDVLCDDFGEDDEHHKLE